MIFKLQSFVDIITNSSIEVYCQATQKTVDVVKDLINVFLENTNQTCDSLFEIKLRSSMYQEWIKDDIDCVDGLTEDEYIQRELSSDYNEGCPHLYIEVIAKNDNDLLAKKVSELLNKLHNSYETGEYMC